MPLGPFRGGVAAGEVNSPRRGRSGRWSGSGWRSAGTGRRLQHLTFRADRGEVHLGGVGEAAAPSRSEPASRRHGDGVPGLVRQVGQVEGDDHRRRCPTRIRHRRVGAEQPVAHAARGRRASAAHTSGRRAPRPAARPSVSVTLTRGFANGPSTGLQLHPGLGGQPELPGIPTVPASECRVRCRRSACSLSSGRVPSGSMPVDRPARPAGCRSFGPELGGLPGELLLTPRPPRRGRTPTRSTFANARSTMSTCSGDISRPAAPPPDAAAPAPTADRSSTSARSAPPPPGPAGPPPPTESRSVAANARGSVEWHSSLASSAFGAARTAW